MTEASRGRNNNEQRQSRPPEAPRADLNVLERAVLLSAVDTIGARDLHFYALAPSPAMTPASQRWSATVPSALETPAVPLEASQRQHNVLALEATGGNVEGAAQLAIPLSTLYQKIRAMQIAIPKAGNRFP